MPASLHVSQFDYPLPQERIAQTPVDPPHHSRLLVCRVDTGGISHSRMDQLPRWLDPGDLLVVNDTKVRPARLPGRRLPGGGRVELVLLERIGPWPEQPGAEVWECLARPGRRLHPPVELELAQGKIQGRVLSAMPQGTRRVALWAVAGASLPEALAAWGKLPLPPYLKRDVPHEEYQTMFARREGSLAAPTAGLHFTPDLLAALAARGLEMATVTLHVGPGTFQPVRVEEVAQHRLPPEYIRVPPQVARAVAAARQRRRRVVAVGTTVARALETAAREAPAGSGTIEPYEGWTDLFIYPGYEFRVVDALLTNFHLPRSTLLMLVCAFAGRELVLQVYEQALAAGYRFASLGDAGLWLRGER